jgi:hypothetical protein
VLLRLGGEGWRLSVETVQRRLAVKQEAVGIDHRTRVDKHVLEACGVTVATLDALVPAPRLQLGVAYRDDVHGHRL